MPGNNLATLKSAAHTFMMKTLVMAFGKVGADRNCTHEDENGYTIVDGQTIHCKCGESFRVKCMHIRVTKLLPKVWQCVDCKTNRGAGEVDGAYGAIPVCACGRDMVRTFGERGWIGWKCAVCPNVSIVEGRKP